MRVRLLVDCEGPNPNFDQSQPAYDDNPINIVLPKGTEIEDKSAWMLCTPEHMGDIRAEPIDEEAKKRVAFALRRMNLSLRNEEALALVKEEAAVAAEQGKAAMAEQN